MCRKCAATDQKTKYCPSALMHTDSVKVEDKRKEQRAAVGTSPLCTQAHTYTRKRDQSKWPSDRLFNSEMFLNMTLADRVRVHTLELQKC